MTDADLARTVAEEAGALLHRLRSHSGASGRELGALGDREANDLILARLREARPDDPILSEESCDDRARLASRRVWIVDPLDGTREYSEGRDDWAVHIGLSIDGVAAAGAVALPGQGVVRATGDRPFAPSGPAARPRIVVSRTRPPHIAEAIARALDADLVPMGSAGAKAMKVVAGEADAYLHAGGQYEWDNCAPVAVAAHFGLHASRIDGTPLRYNGETPKLPDLLICRPSLAPAILRLVETLR